MRKLYGALAALVLFGYMGTDAQAGAVYPLYKEQLLQGGTNTSLAGTVKCQLATASYTYSATHQFLSDVSAGLVSTAQTLASKTYTGGKFTSSAITFTAVASGSTITQDLCWVDTGTASTSKLVVNNTGFSVLSNGGDIVLTPDSTYGWFSL